MPEICEPNVIQPGLSDDLIVQPAHRLRQVGRLCGRVLEPVSYTHLTLPTT